MDSRYTIADGRGSNAIGGDRIFAAGHARHLFNRSVTVAARKRARRRPSMPGRYKRFARRLLIQLFDVVAKILDDARAPHFHGGGQFAFLDRKFAL
jgi:hypothetical protein